MIKTIPHGKYKRLNYSSKITCDECGEDCTNEFVEIFINKFKLNDTTTAMMPFEQTDNAKKELCVSCYRKKYI